MLISATPVAHLVEEVNLSLAKAPLISNDGLGTVGVNFFSLESSHVINTEVGWFIWNYLRPPTKCFTAKNRAKGITVFIVLYCNLQQISVCGTKSEFFSIPTHRKHCNYTQWDMRHGMLYNIQRWWLTQTMIFLCTLFK